MDNITYCSIHGSERIRQRCGVSKKSARRCAENAVARGTHYTQTKGSLRRWLDGKIHYGRQIYVYGDKAYVFAEDSLTLITVLQMPPGIARLSNQSRKKTAQESIRQRRCTQLLPQ